MYRLHVLTFVIVCVAVLEGNFFLFCFVLLHLNKHMIKSGQHFVVKYEACDEKFSFPDKIIIIITLTL